MVSYAIKRPATAEIKWQKGAKMDRNFNKARTQGILGAVCILCASASFLASDQSLFWIVRTLAWLFSLTFFHYALIRAQELSNSNVFTIIFGREKRIKRSFKRIDTFITKYLGEKFQQKFQYFK